MTAIEDACRWSIVQAYCTHATLHRTWTRRRMVEYARALGLDPLDRLIEGWEDYDT
jgi:hypothetical protein